MLCCAIYSWPMQMQQSWLTTSINCFIDHLRDTNPVVKRFKTLQERNLEELRERRLNACPTVPASTLGRGVAATQVSGYHALGCAALCCGALW